MASNKKFVQSSIKTLLKQHRLCLYFRTTFLSTPICVVACSDCLIVETSICFIIRMANPDAFYGLVPYFLDTYGHLWLGSCCCARSTMWGHRAGILFVCLSLRPRTMLSKTQQEKWNPSKPWRPWKPSREWSRKWRPSRPRYLFIIVFVLQMRP